LVLNLKNNKVIKINHQLSLTFSFSTEGISFCNGGATLVLISSTEEDSFFCSEEGRPSSRTITVEDPSFLVSEAHPNF